MNNSDVCVKGSLSNYNEFKKNIDSKVHYYQNEKNQKNDAKEST